MNNDVFDKIAGGLIVSCQALSHEALYGGDTMAKMAVAAVRGGAVGIRANSVHDICLIKKAVNVPVIGIIKQIYNDSDVYITPTMDEVDALVGCNVDIIAVDATKRIRPNGVTLDEFFHTVREKYPRQLFMADTSCFEEGERAAQLGFDLIGTTMSGYTPYTKGTVLPDIPLMKRYVTELDKPVIAEGGIWTPEQLKAALDTGVLAAVVGTAITRPMEITQRFVEKISR